MLGRPAWRRPDYELYAWDQFPSVLFFDTRDYAVQDAFFKRLAFFAEKKGYRGRLARDREIDSQHGFNAYDYRGETLGAFFSLAEETGFPLNPHEELLRDILLANGIIAQQTGGLYTGGNGAVISISMESPDYLRRQFIVHEGLHGIYFTQPEFREEVERVYAGTDPRCVDFLLGYFDVTPTLAYDLADTYLVQNEFMAYLLQQPLGAAEAYFADQIANRIYINRYHPELAQYVRDTRARGLCEAAAKLSDFLTQKWNLEAGRVWKTHQ
jgi:hypothetical protein